MKKYAADSLTGCRILFGAGMMMFPVFSFWFYVLYLMGGITDIADGIVARKTQSESVFGSRFDIFADFLFLLSAFIKILPTVAADISKPFWIWILIITVLKITSILFGFLRNKRLLAEHTVLNKLTGFFLFLLPLTFSFLEIRYGITVVCAAATAAAIQEGYFIRKGIEVSF